MGCVISEPNHINLLSEIKVCPFETRTWHFDDYLVKFIKLNVQSNSGNLQHINFICDVIKSYKEEILKLNLFSLTETNKKVSIINFKKTMEKLSKQTYNKSNIYEFKCSYFDDTGEYPKVYPKKQKIIIKSSVINQQVILIVITNK